MRLADSCEEISTVNEALARKDLVSYTFIVFSSTVQDPGRLWR